MQNHPAPKPHRKIETKIEISADNNEALIGALKQLIFEVSIDRLPKSSVSGGYSYGWTITSTVDENQTHEQYAKELDAYLGSADFDSSCGAQDPIDDVVCMLPKNHVGKHAWELKRDYA